MPKTQLQHITSFILYNQVLNGQKKKLKYKKDPISVVNYLRDETE